MLQLLNIVNIYLTKNRLKLRSRSKIINNFQNEIENKAIKILIETYILNFVDLNLQKNCRNVYLFDFFCRTKSTCKQQKKIEKSIKLEQLS